ncbi:MULTISPECIES: hypothetical protein [unclassified Brenneria]|uniref:hypothetical protein n=1 Tax=unclassified Brenneria TaxID=2634434 RepID=UPI0029C18986|nr:MULTISPECIES: hypothetical protein [unclassified Brenneria]MDX5631096.1 hypothetical protein [Brenneria sp. L3-3Z]MDX5698169.1 hypothetical protein [Brenneria sp. L4-2C]
MAQEGALPDTEHYRYDPAANLLDEGQCRQRHNRVTHYKGIHYRYDTFGRTVEKHKDRYRYDAEHRLTEVIRHSAHYNEPEQHVQFRYDPLGRRTHKQVWLQIRDLPQPTGQRQTTTFLWEGFRLLQETRNGTPLTYVYADQGSYEPLARIDGIAHAQVCIFIMRPTANRKA